MVRDAVIKAQVLSHISAYFLSLKSATFLLNIQGNVQQMFVMLQNLK